MRFLSVECCWSGAIVVREEGFEATGTRRGVIRWDGDRESKGGGKNRGAFLPEAFSSRRGPPQKFKELFLIEASNGTL